MTSGEELRREGLFATPAGEPPGRPAGDDRSAPAGTVDWPLIESATGIDEQTYRGLKAGPGQRQERSGAIVVSAEGLPFLQGGTRPDCEAN